MTMARLASRRPRRPPRQGLSPAGPVRRLAGQSRDLVVGRRDPGRLQRGLSQGQRPRAPQHRPRPARGAPAGAEPRRRAHLDDREPGRRGVADPGRQGPARGHAGRAEGEALERVPRRDRLHASRLRAHGPDDRRQRRAVPVLLLDRSRPSLEGPVPAAPLRPGRDRRAHRLPRQRPARLPALPDGREGRPQGGPAALRAHPRRRQDLAVRRLDRPRAHRLRDHALDRAAERPRAADRDPPPRRTEALDRDLPVAGRRPELDARHGPRARTWAKATRRA